MGVQAHRRNYGYERFRGFNDNLGMHFLQDWRKSNELDCVAQTLLAINQYPLAGDWFPSPIGNMRHWFLYSIQRFSKAKFEAIPSPYPVADKKPCQSQVPFRLQVIGIDCQRRFAILNRPGDVSRFAQDGGPIAIGDRHTRI